MAEALRVQKLLIEQNAEIDRLKNRIEQLEAALRDALSFVEYRSYAWDCESNTVHPAIIVENARAALGEKKDD